MIVCNKKILRVSDFEGSSPEGILVRISGYYNLQIFTIPTPKVTITYDDVC